MFSDGVNNNSASKVFIVEKDPILSSVNVDPYSIKYA